MRKGLLKYCGFVLVAIMIFAAFIGCSGTKGNITKIYFVSEGNSKEISVLQEIVNTYNQGQGVKDGVYVNYTYKGSDGYQNYIQNSAKGRNTYDVLIVNDRYFKRWAGTDTILQNLTELAQQVGLSEELDEISSGMFDGAERFRYNVNQNTSNSTDPLYGLMRDLTPTVLYYNESAFEKLGIKVISEYEENIDDEYAQKINEQYSLTGEHKVTATDLKHAFYREEDFGENIQTGETMFFNNRIAMSWEELEEIGRLNTKSFNPSASTTKGHYQWWWFNYGFSVGGDCIEDITGEGDWVFTLGDDVSNFIVADSVSEITVNGNKYSAGETIGYKDRVNLTDSVKADLLANGSNLTNNNLRTEILTLENEGKLIRLPSQKEAFVRYIMLAQNEDTSYDGQNGKEISPIPQESTLTGFTGMFTSEKVAMLVDKSQEFLIVESNMNGLAETNKFNWNVAPLPQYKEYNEDGTVKVRGKMGGASDANAYAVNANSSKKEAALKFILYAAGDEAENILAKVAYTLPNNERSSEIYVSTRTDFNFSIIKDAAEYETPGDWWYMPDRNWIETTWAPALNNQVRNNKMGLEEFFGTYIKLANDALQLYKK